MKAFNELFQEWRDAKTELSRDRAALENRTEKAKRKLDLLTREIETACLVNDADREARARALDDATKADLQEIEHILSGAEIDRLAHQVVAAGNEARTAIEAEQWSQAKKEAEQARQSYLDALRNLGQVAAESNGIKRCMESAGRYLTDRGVPGVHNKTGHFLKVPNGWISSNAVDIGAVRSALNE